FDAVDRGAASSAPWRTTQAPRAVPPFVDSIGTRRYVVVVPRIAIEDGPGSIQERMYRQLRPELESAADAMRSAVYGHTIRQWRTFEGVRYRMAIANGCLACQSLEARTQAALDAGFTESMYEEMDSGTWRESDEFSPAEKLAIDYAERFALDHESIDDD